MPTREARWQLYLSWSWCLQHTWLTQYRWLVVIYIHFVIYILPLERRKGVPTPTMIESLARPKTQCAAVKIHWAFKIAPPQKWKFLLVRSDTWKPGKVLNQWLLAHRQQFFLHWQRMVKTLRQRLWQPRPKQYFCTFSPNCFTFCASFYSFLNLARSQLPLSYLAHVGNLEKSKFKLRNALWKLYSAFIYSKLIIFYQATKVNCDAAILNERLFYAMLVRIRSLMHN